MFKLIMILSQLMGKYPDKALDYISERDISNFFDGLKESFIRYKNMEAENRKLSNKVLFLENKLRSLK